MESIRQVAKIYTENVHIANEYYSNGLNVDVIKARDLVYTDRIVTKLWWYDWNLHDMSQDFLYQQSTNHWCEKTFCVMPENVEWCDCHLDNSYNNKCKKALQTFQNLDENETFTSDILQLSSMTNNFYHYGDDTVFYGNCVNLLYDDNPPHESRKHQSYKPNKMHLKIWWHDTYEGEREMVWFYPDDLVLRIDENSWKNKTYEKIEDTSISDYDTFDYAPHYTHQRFVEEKLENWTYDPEKSKVCDTCNGRHRENQTFDIKTIIKDTVMYQCIYWSEMIKKACIYAQYTRNVDLTGLISDIADIPEDYFDILPAIIRENLDIDDEHLMDALKNNNKTVLDYVRKEFNIKTRNPIFTEQELAELVLHLKEKYVQLKTINDSENIVEYFLENWFEKPVKMPLLEENGRIKNTI